MSTPPVPARRAGPAAGTRHAALRTALIEEVA